MNRLEFWNTGRLGRLKCKLIQKKNLELKNNYFKLTHFCPKPFQSVPSVPTKNTLHRNILRIIIV